MRNVSTGQKKLLAEFSANIGVAWFAGGVVGIFINESSNLFGILKSLTWGICLATIFIYTGFRIMRGVK